MTEEQAELILKLADNLREGINNNFNFNKVTADAILKCADAITSLEKRVKVLEGKTNE